MTTSFVARFYEGLEHNQLLAFKCTDCGANSTPPHGRCDACGSRNGELAALSGKGTLLFASHGIAPPPNPRFAELAPLTYGHVMLDEGIPIQAIVTNIDPTPEAIEALYDRGPVKVVLDPVQAQDLKVPGFRVV